MHVIQVCYASCFGGATSHLGLLVLVQVGAARMVDPGCSRIWSQQAMGQQLQALAPHVEISPLSGLPAFVVRMLEDLQGASSAEMARIPLNITVTTRTHGLN
jgi:hypothetical protein